MKISILVPGRLHGFDMALYFQKLGCLNELVTGYPSKFVVPFGIEKRFVKDVVCKSPLLSQAPKAQYYFILPSILPPGKASAAAFH